MAEIPERCPGHCGYCDDKHRKWEEALELAEARIRELELQAERDERAHLQTIDQRDAAEEALGQSYFLVTGRSPEWSNLFGHEQALGDIDDAQVTLRMRIRELEQERDRLSERNKTQQFSIIDLQEDNIAIQAQLQAVTQERDGLKRERKLCVDVVRDMETSVAQLQARNSQLEKALQHIRSKVWGDDSDFLQLIAEIADAALNPATKEPAGRSCKDCGTLIPPAEGCNGHCWACHRDYEQTLELQRKASEP